MRKHVAGLKGLLASCAWSDRTISPDGLATSFGPFHGLSLIIKPLRVNCLPPLPSSRGLDHGYIPRCVHHQRRHFDHCPRAKFTGSLEYSLKGGMRPIAHRFLSPNALSAWRSEERRTFANGGEGCPYAPGYLYITVTFLVGLFDICFYIDNIFPFPDESRLTSVDLSEAKSPSPTPSLK